MFSHSVTFADNSELREIRKSQLRADRTALGITPQECQLQMTRVVAQLGNSLFNIPIPRDSFQPPRNDMDLSFWEGDASRISILHDRLNGLYAIRKVAIVSYGEGVNKNNGLCIKSRQN
jgi:hypothetical protein